MIIPFVDHCYETFEIGNDVLKYLRVLIRWQKIIIEEAQTVQIDNSDIESITDTLKQMHDPRAQQSIVILPSSEFSIINAGIPIDLDDEEYVEWIHDQISINIHKELNQISYDTIKPTLTDDIYVIWTDRATIETCEGMLAAAGITAFYLGSGIEFAGQGYLFNNDKFSSELTVLSSLANGRYSFGYREGQLERIQSRISGEDEQSVDEQIDITSKLPIAYLACYASILHQRYKLEPTNDFSTPQMIDKARLVTEKRRSIWISMLLALILTVIFIPAGFGILWTRYSIQAKEMTLDTLRVSTDELLRDQQRLKILKRQVKAYNEILDKKSHTGGYIEIVTKHVPDPVRLSEITITNRDECVDIFVKGTSDQDGFVAEYMRRLDNDPHLKNVHLAVLKNKEINANTRKSRKEIYFEITGNVCE